MTSAGHHIMLGGASAPPAPAYWGLCFTAEEPNVVVNMAKTGSPPAVTLETSTDGVTWTAFDADGGTTPITLAAIGDRVFFRAGAAVNAKISSSTSAYRSFTLSGNCAASGNCMSLISASDPTVVFTSTNTYAFSSLFRGCTSLTSAPELPATTLAANCYRSMFQGCTSLVTAPELPATSSANSCYRSMFQGCTSLAVPPRLRLVTGILPSTTNFPYRDIFTGCTAISAPIQVDYLPPLVFRSYYSGIFGTSISPTGIVRTFEASAEEILSGLPEGWTLETIPHAFSMSTRYAVDVKLTIPMRVSYDFGASWAEVGANKTVSVGALGAVLFDVTRTDPPTGERSLFTVTTTTESGRLNMAGDATSLVVRGGNLTAVPDNALYYALGDLVYKPNSTYKDLLLGARFVRIPAAVGVRGCDSLFSRNPTLDSAPALPATTLAALCYSGMFSGCTALTSAPALPATTLAALCYSGMFSGCTALTWLEISAMSWGNTNCFYDWVTGVAASGTFRCPTALGTDATIERGTNRCPVGWTVVNID